MKYSMKSNIKYKVDFLNTTKRPFSPFMHETLYFMGKYR